MDDLTRLIIIPDVHGRGFWRDAVTLFPNAEFVFLGDYLDPYEEEGISNEKAYSGLLEILELKRIRPDRVTLLWGNHDLHYLYPEMMGSRYDVENAERNARTFWDHRELFKMAYAITAGNNNYLLTHAGIGRKWITGTFPELTESDIGATLINELVGYPPFMHALEDVSCIRGGDKQYGSMVWADLREHIPEENQLPVIQIFGHTRVAKAFNWGNRFYCLDCAEYFIMNKDTGRIYDSSGREVIPFPIPQNE